jgi:hypothetical protein
MKHRPWYRKKRVMIPLAALVAIAVAAAYAIVRSDTSRIMVYNETGAPLSAVHITACGQSRTFPKVPSEASVRWKLARQGGGTDITLEAATDPPLNWRGSYIESHGGYHITLRIWPDGQVEEHRQISFWQRVVNGAPDINQ